MSIVKANVKRRNFRGIVISSVFGGIQRAADRSSRASIAQRFDGFDAEHITRGLAIEYAVFEK
jgi:hypothetical protein